MKFNVERLLLLLILVTLVLETVFLPQIAFVLYLPTIVLLGMSFYSFWRDNQFPKWQLAMAGVAIVSFFLLKPLIAATEFWGDEIGVIVLAQKSFLKIAPEVLETHIVVPPFDYQNLHFWLLLTQWVPVTEREFFWRGMYFLFHIAAALVFAHLIFKLNLRESKTDQVRFAWLAFLLYFTYPIFFTYGIEIRFYTFGILCGLILLHELILKKYTHWRWLILAVLAPLNMASFGFFVLSLAIPKMIQLWKIGGKKELYAWAILILTEVIIAVSFGLTLLKPYGELATDFSWYQLKTVWTGFLATNSHLLIGLVGCLPFFIWYPNLRRTRTSSLFFLSILSSLVFGLLILGSFTLHPHTDIGVRHFILVFPGLLLAYCQLLIQWHKKLAVILLTLLIGVQCLIILHNFQKHTLEGKDNYFAKQAMTLAKSQRKSVMLLLSPDLPHGYPEFFTFTFDWYALQYSVNFSAETITKTTCDRIKEKRTPLPCDWDQTTLIEY